MSKYATGGVFGKLMSDPHFWAPAVAMGAGAAVTGMSAAVGKLVDARNQAKNFKEMMDLHPSLKTRDPALVKRLYSSLHNVNPMMARDPLISGGWVDTIIESGGSLGEGMAARALLEGVKDLAKIRSDITSSQQRETSVSKTIGSGVSRMIEGGFSRAKEIGQEQGALATAHKQIKDIQESHVLDRQQKVQKDLTRSLGEVTSRLRQAGTTPQQINQMVTAFVTKHSSETPGQRLIAACSR